ncbi:MAG: putative TrmH family tRNA/rRNA methyltransferase [Acidobacteria bacterium]|nr:putative TrmH family tRNA/rRNA methyltransferase [Acidobacteriota bacterium]
MRHITSRHHPLVGDCRALARGPGRGSPRLLLDGPHLVEEALAAGLAIEAVLLGEAFAASAEGGRLARALAAAGVEVLTASAAVLDAASPVSTPSGIVAIAARPATPLARALEGPRPLAVIAVDVQDPGNVGAIVRAAEAGGATGAIFCGASADPLGWKSLRGSMGSALRLPLAHGLPWRDAVAAAKTAGLRVAAAAARAGVPMHAADFCRPTALLLGGEGPGLPPEAVAAADEAVAIPMAPRVESLNVAVAAALLVYEARRQRQAAAGPPPACGRAR